MTPLGADLEQQIEKISENLIHAGIQARKNNYGENVYSAENWAIKQATQQILALLESSNKASRIAEIENLIARTTPPEGHFSIISGRQIRDYLNERLAELSAEGEQK